MTRAIAHVDMDAFYAAVEQRDRPELRGRPVVVGADPTRRGVVAAASYEARRFGIRSAMPSRRAARLCPDAVFVPVDMPRYQDVSREIMTILGEFSPLVEQVSVDEAFVDLTATRSLFGDPVHVVQRIKSRILAQTRLTASAGLAGNKFVAKVASDLRKPDGLVVVPPGSEAAFLADLPVERLWGVGPVMTRELAALGIRAIGQLQRIPKPILARRFGRHGDLLHELAFGRDDRPVCVDAPAKSIGAEETFGTDCRDPGRLQITLRRQAERVARELRGEGLTGATVTLKLRYADFRTLTRRATADPTQDGLEIYRRARSLLAREDLEQPVRLIGLSVAGLRNVAGAQLSLFDRAAVRRDRVARAVDRLASRFGEDAVVPAALLGRPERDRWAR